MLYDSATCPCDSHVQHARAMECAPSRVPFRVYVTGAMLRGDQRRRPIPASILLNTICVDDPRIPTLGIGGFLFRKEEISCRFLSDSRYSSLASSVLLRAIDSPRLSHHAAQSPSPAHPPPRILRPHILRPQAEIILFLFFIDIGYFFMDFTPRFGISAIILEKEPRFFAN